MTFYQYFDAVFVFKDIEIARVKLTPTEPIELVDPPFGTVLLEFFNEGNFGFTDLSDQKPTYVVNALSDELSDKTRDERVLILQRRIEMAFRDFNDGSTFSISVGEPGYEEQFSWTWQVEHYLPSSAR